MDDFVVTSATWFLNQKVTTYDAAGNELPDDGSYQRSGAETVYVFADFLKSKNLFKGDFDSTRRPDLEIRFSDLTDEGQRFTRYALHKWMQAMDRAGPNKPVESSGLEKRWKKFIGS